MPYPGGLQGLYRVHDCWQVYLGGVGLDAKSAFFLSGTDSQDESRGVVIAIRPRADPVEVVAVAPAPSADLTIFLARYDLACFRAAGVTGAYHVTAGAFESGRVAEADCDAASASS